MLVCIGKETWVGDLLPRTGRFCVNVLAHNQRDVAEAFAGVGGVSGEDRFRFGSWTIGSTGAPVLEESSASFDCFVEGIIERSTHLLVIGEVEEARMRGGRPDPLIWVERSFKGIR
jgi:flavin reductase (DIM6/NTAB) family NADH-FMN oxidoreductase RutF